MKIYLQMVCVLGLGALIGCSVPLSQAGAGVKLSKEEPAAGCTEIGTVTGQGNVDDIERAKNEMRNHAANLGANYVRWDTHSASGSKGILQTLSGTAFKCP